MTTDLSTRVIEMDADMRVLKSDVAALKGDVSEIGRGVRELITREAKRPEPMNGKSLFFALASVAGGLASISAVVWWLIGSAPVIKDLNDANTALSRRLDRLDDSEVGRVGDIERRVTKIEGWIVKVTPSPTFVTVTPAARVR